jgi:hypothetical protein
MSYLNNGNTTTYGNDMKYDNPNVQRKRQELGPFKYDDGSFDAQLRGKVEERPQEKLDNDAKYTGQWLKGTTTRQGRGTQIWPDGSQYEGYW